MLTFNKNGTEDLITSKEAAALSSYTPDYIDQLCRENKVECQLIKDTWHISKNSLLKYKKESEERNAKIDKAIEKASEKLERLPKNGRSRTPKKLRIIKTHLINEHFSGKKLARLHRAIQDGSYKASSVLSHSIGGAPTRDFWHKALSMITAIILVFGSYFFLEAGVLNIRWQNTSFGQNAAVRDAVSGIHAFAADISPATLADSTIRGLKLGSLTAKFAVNEITHDPFGFILRAGYSAAAEYMAFYEDGKIASQNVVSSVKNAAGVLSLWR